MADKREDENQQQVVEMADKSENEKEQQVVEMADKSSDDEKKQQVVEMADKSEDEKEQQVVEMADKSSDDEKKQQVVEMADKSDDEKKQVKQTTELKKEKEFARQGDIIYATTGKLPGSKVYYFRCYRFSQWPSSITLRQTFVCLEKGCKARIERYKEQHSDDDFMIRLDNWPHTHKPDFLERYHPYLAREAGIDQRQHDHSAQSGKGQAAE